MCTRPLGISPLLDLVTIPPLQVTDEIIGSGVLSICHSLSPQAILLMNSGEKGGLNEELWLHGRFFLCC